MITVPVPYSNAERSRDMVAVILKDNLDYQYEHGYNPYADVDKVFVETTNPNDFTELSIVEVGIDNIPYSGKTYAGSVTASVTINIDVYVKSKTTAGTKGDSASRMKCMRLLNICRYILEDPIYKTLGFAPGFISGVSVESIGMADPEKYDTQNVSMGRLVLSVICTEKNSLLSGGALEESVTEHRIGTTDEGFRYITSAVNLPEITVSPLSIPFGDLDVGEVSNSQSVIVSGDSLTDGILVSHANGFIVNLDDSSSDETPFTIPAINGAVESIQVFIKFAPIDDISYDSALNFSSDGATTRSVELSGTGLPVTTYDPATQDFLDATGITDLTISTAIDFLVKSLKGIDTSFNPMAYNLWVNSKIIYPFVGGTAMTHKYNLRSPQDLDTSFRLVFFGGWVHNSNGISSNGTNSYADTFYWPSVESSVNGFSLGAYYRFIATGTDQITGCYDGQYFVQNATKSSIGPYVLAGSPGSLISIAASNKFIFMRRTSNTDFEAYVNGVSVGTDADPANGLPNLNIFIGANNQGGVATFFTSNTNQLEYVGGSMTHDQSVVLNNIVVEFQTKLGRNV